MFLAEFSLTILLLSFSMLFLLILFSLKSKNPIFSIKALILLLLAFAIQRPMIYGDLLSNEDSSAILLDVSDSMDADVSKALLERARSFAPKAELINFAGEVNSSFNLMGSSTNQKETNIENAFRKAQSSGVGSIILISDGYETSGNALLAAESSGIPIYPLIPKANETKSSSLKISQLSAPLFAPPGEKVDIRIAIDNRFNEEKSGNLRVLHDGEEIYSQNLTLTNKQELVKQVKSNPTKSGTKEITAIFSPKDKSIPESIRRIFISTAERRSVLMLSGSEADERYLKPLLQDFGFNVESKVASVSKLDHEFSEYSSVIFNNTDASNIPPALMEALPNLVEKGALFLMIGGNRSFGLGNYIGSNIEKILPVRLVPPQKKEKRLNLALQLVIDKSRSMATEQRLEFVKNAAREVINNLKGDDLIGVTAFDSNPFAVIPLAPLSQNRNMALDRIGILFPTGRTNLLPAMDIARKSLEAVRAGRKHMIILTDGDLPDSGPFYVEFVKQMRLSGITVSTVLIGPEFDRLLRTMAESGGGAFYNTSDPRNIPKIFLRDVKIRSGEETLKESSEFPVKRNPRITPLSTIDSFPPLLGFVETRSREDSTNELFLTSQGSAFPLFSYRSIGKGKSYAFTSDANGRWSAPWASWREFSRFWRELLENFGDEDKGADKNTEFDLRYGLNGNSLELELVVFGNSRPKLIEALLKQEEKSKNQLVFEKQAPGRFKALLPDPKPGIYQLEMKLDSKALTPLSFELPKELFGERKGEGFNASLLSEIAEASDGSINPLSISPKQLEGKPSTVDLSIFFILLAALLFVLEIFLRELRPRFLGFLGQKA